MWVSDSRDNWIWSWQSSMEIRRSWNLVDRIEEEEIEYTKILLWCEKSLRTLRNWNWIMCLDTWVGWRLGADDWHNESFFIDVNEGDVYMKNISTLLGRIRKIHVSKEKEYISIGEIHNMKRKISTNWCMGVLWKWGVPLNGGESKSYLVCE